jgi:hypothetical protein
MTDFLYRSQQGVPSEAILEDSRGSAKQLSIPNLPPQDRLSEVSSSLTTAIDHEAAEASHLDRQFDPQNRGSQLTSQIVMTQAE